MGIIALLDFVVINIVTNLYFILDSLLLQHIAAVWRCPPPQAGYCYRHQMWDDHRQYYGPGKYARINDITQGCGCPTQCTSYHFELVLVTLILFWSIFGFLGFVQYLYGLRIERHARLKRLAAGLPDVVFDEDDS